MTANGPVEQARSVLAEVTELMRAPNPQNLEKALPVLDHAKNLLELIPAPERRRLPDLERTLNDLLRIAEQTAAFYLGLAAAVLSHSGSYDSAGETAIPSGCSRLSVDA